MDFNPVVLAHPQAFMEYSEWRPSSQLLYIDVYHPMSRTWSTVACKMAIDYNSGVPLSVIATRYFDRGSCYLEKRNLVRPEKIVKYVSLKGGRCGNTRPTMAALNSIIELSDAEFLSPETVSRTKCADVYAVLSAMIYDAHVAYVRGGKTYVDRFPITHLRFTSAMRPVEIVGIYPYEKPKVEYREKITRKAAPSFK